MKKLRNTRGITLIALIVTIIVLLILVGVSISMLTGEHGILTQAKNAKLVNLKAGVEEQVDLAYTAGQTKFLSEIARGKKASKVTGAEILEHFENELKPSENYEITVNKTEEAGENGEIELTINIAGTILSQYRQATNDGRGNYTTIIKYSGETGKLSYEAKHVWGQEPIRYEITFNANGGEFADGTTTKVVAVIENATITVPSEKPKSNTSGYVFEGWYTATTGGSKLTGTEKATGNATYYAQYVEKEEIARGTYISNYGITYTDMNATSLSYDNTGEGKYGWRILNVEDNLNGTYDIDIISTGVPAQLYYSYSSVTNFDWGKETGTYADDYYYYSSKTDKNIYAANGLLNKFEEITFNSGGAPTSANYGGYTNISGYSSGKQIFRASNLLSGEITKVRSVMHTDLAPGEDNIKNKTWYNSTAWTNTKNADTSGITKGLFVLQNLNSAYRGYYWLASPYVSGLNSLRLVDYDGFIDYSNSSANGVRPVVSISNVKLSEATGGVCSIIQ